jgi:hypothetical protein
MIRLFVEEDRAGLRELIFEFYAQISPEMSLGIAHNRCDELIDEYKDNTYVFIDEGRYVGAVCGRVIKLGLSDDTCFVETFFYMAKDYRKRFSEFLRGIEGLVRYRGHKSIVMTQLSDYTDKRLVTLYKRKGYRELETHLIKKLG